MSDPRDRFDIPDDREPEDNVPDAIADWPPPDPEDLLAYRTKSGKVLTFEEVERLADEAEQGYDHLREKP